MAVSGFTGVKVFSATKAGDRNVLGERISAWLSDRPEHEVVDVIVTQSSDAAFHCIAVTLFWRIREP
jgi:hypothetical protein